RDVQKRRVDRQTPAAAPDAQGVRVRHPQARVPQQPPAAREERGVRGKSENAARDAPRRGQAIRDPVSHRQQHGQRGHDVRGRRRARAQGGRRRGALGGGRRHARRAGLTRGDRGGNVRSQRDGDRLREGEARRVHPGEVGDFDRVGVRRRAGVARRGDRDDALERRHRRGVHAVGASVDVRPEEQTRGREPRKKFGERGAIRAAVDDRLR
ncbi:uncharacterized protein MICPUCDRAFT_46708, partial [Micromonas pusilla CCMP1545]